MKNTFNLKKIMPVALGVVVFAIAFFATQYFLSSSKEDKVLADAALVEKVAEISKNYPLMLDADTRLENATYSLENNIYQYNHTLLNITLTEVTENLDAMKETLTAKLITNLKSNPETELFRENETSMVYYFNDRDGNAILEITITPKLYQ